MKLKIKKALPGAILCFASGFLLATRYKTFIQVIGNSLISGIQSIMLSRALGIKARAKLRNLIIDVIIAVIFAIAGGSGVGTKFWNSGFSAYYVKIFKSIKSLRPAKRVIQAFLKAFGYYIAGNLTGTFKNLMIKYKYN